MKQLILKAIRGLGALGIADQIHYYFHRLISSPKNILFRRQSPDFPLPPPRLAFESYGHTSWHEYEEMGQAHADIIAGLIRERLGDEPVRVLEWGCGAGRILRHVAQQPGWTALGVDVDPEPVQWCHQHLPSVQVKISEFEPPLPFESASVDAIYHYSVWTHLSSDIIESWVEEFARVLRPGGVMIATTHGEAYLPMLMPDERALFEQGQIVSRGQVVEGRKYFLTFHPAVAIKKLLGKYFSDIEYRPASPGDIIPQDIWLVTR